MLEKKYTIPVVFGIFLGLIMAGVQVSSGALGAALGQQRQVAPVVIESTEGNRVDMQAFGKRFSISLSLPGGPAGLAGGVVEKAGGLYSRCREKVCRAAGGIAGFVESGRVKMYNLYWRWKDPPE